MKRIILSCAILTTTLAFAAPAQALLTRTFVSAAGSDSNPCTITQPCATFAHAYSVTAASGIIAALDPGKYGPLTITGPITINGNGWAAITAPAGGNGITINAGASDKIELIGLEVDGAGAGFNGVVLNSGGDLMVTNCSLQYFVFDGSNFNTGSGILIQPMSGSITFAITRTLVANNGNEGILYYGQAGSGAASGVIDNVVATGNFDGIAVVTVAASSTAIVGISNSIASNNTDDGIFLSYTPGPLKASIDNVSAVGNAHDGIEATGTANVLLGRSVVTGNTNDGVDNQTSNTFFTYKDNRINNNTAADVSGALNTTLTLQ